MSKQKKALENKEIVEKIVEGIQEKKGKKTEVVHVNKQNEAPCSYQSLRHI